MKKRTITHATLLKKIKDGEMEVSQWIGYREDATELNAWIVARRVVKLFLVTAIPKGAVQP